ncbi:glycosyl hydrolase family 47 protein [Ascosphaera apis ARSEF 7405]|uniref:alpha-1,2-Mannosidase n=1 Tax=Ascosphaera apis ARSEF 7405 TaxID=392613 RepID=A0A167UVK6_9EURO|nr:glycosyl hydrolase family 47 protein [Ascosphaera apis ARSEF 7405]
MPWSSRRSKQRAFFFFVLFVALCLLLYQRNVTRNTLAHLEAGLNRPQHAHHSQQQQQHQSGQQVQGLDHQEKPSPAVNKFSWSNYKEHYPVSSMVKLPAGDPGKLPKVQFDFPEPSKDFIAEQKARRAAVKEAFKRGWSNYRERAWMQDELRPLSGTAKNGFGGWAATLVDNLDTLWILGMKDEFKEAVEAASTIDFTVTQEQTINVFETTIRYLGGLLSAYDLSKELVLLEKASELGDMLYAAFDTPNRMPITRWKINDAIEGKKQTALDWSIMSEIGSFTMEFTHLTQLTGNPKYYDAISRIMQVYKDQQNETRVPGMWPMMVSPRRLDFRTHTIYTLSSMADSLYEYLPKTHALLGGTDPMYEELYRPAMETASKHILFRPMLPDEADVLISGKGSTSVGSELVLYPEGQHLACYAGGMFTLGSRLFGIEEHGETGRRLTEGCIWAYNATQSGMMPEIFRMVPCKDPKDCKWDEALYRKEIARKSGTSTSNARGVERSLDELLTASSMPIGFVAMEAPEYRLRPEAIESVFILYRATGRKDLLDAAWNMFSSIDRATRTPFGNAELRDVRYPPQEAQEHLADNMESFWLAETLKYFYLIFSDPNHISLDDWVFNTEAHPFKRPLSRQS